MNEMTVKSDEILCHYGVPGMKWGVRRYRNKDGSLTSTGKKYSDQERKINGKELNKIIEKSRRNSKTGNPSAREVYTNSSTMKKFVSATEKDYRKRNDIYDQKQKVPKATIKRYGRAFSDDDLRVYGYGASFEKLMRKRASEIVYDKKDIDTIMKLVEAADWTPITSTYNEKAWQYWS